MEQPDKQRRLHDALSECETKPQVCMCVCVRGRALITDGLLKLSPSLHRCQTPAGAFRQLLK